MKIKPLIVAQTKALSVLLSLGSYLGSCLGLSLSISLCFLLGFSLKSPAQTTIDLESGIVFTGYNDVKITGRTGTLFSLKNDLVAQPTSFYRLRAGCSFYHRHHVSLLYAPLEIKSKGKFDQDIIFKSATFQANKDIDAFYKFNSYRLTYRYNLLSKPNFILGLGLTMKVRDARIKLNSDNQSDEKISVGLVPLFNLSAQYKFDDKLSIKLIGDGLFASQGRAFDFHLAGMYQASDRVSARIGYRLLEGGSDGSSVYGFALLHYASLGITYHIFLQKVTE